MVNLTGPGFGSAASGSLAQQLTFVTSKGKTYLKRKSRPKQPNTGLQIACRVMLGFLASEWKSLSTPDKATWDQLAETTNVSTFNAYQSYNLKRWGTYKAPSQTYPAAEILTQPTSTFLNPFPTLRIIYLLENITTLHGGWSIAWHRQTTTPVIQTRANAIAIQPTDSLGISFYPDGPLKPGTYYYRRTFYTTDGRAFPENQERSATITA